jgi:hypothetical protein
MEYQAFMFDKHAKILQNMMHTTQWNLTNAQIGNQVKSLQPNKDNDGAAKKACSARENPIYYPSRTKHP